MIPLSQNFTIIDSSNSVGTSIVTRIDVYFKRASNTYGIELHIRPTANGVPSSNTKIDIASKYLSANQVLTSSYSNAATSFIFDRPVILNTNQEYSICIVPMGGSKDYEVWTSTTGEKDVLTGAPITYNPFVGKFFLPSDDTNPQPIPNRFLKYDLYTSVHKTNGTAIFRNNPVEIFDVSDSTTKYFPRDSRGGFFVNEPVYISNSDISLAVLGVSATSVYAGGDIVYQPNTATSYLAANAYGTVYFANTTMIKLSNVVGKFNITDGLSSSANVTCGAPSSVSQNVTITANSTIMTVPDGSYSEFATGRMLYITANNRLFTQSSVIKNISGNNITLDKACVITSNTTSIGRIRGDGSLSGAFSSASGSKERAYITLTNSNANSTINFSNNFNHLLIGSISGASAIVNQLVNIPYESITEMLTYETNTKSKINSLFQGTSNFFKDLDSAPIEISSNSAFEFTDTQRILMSRSNEITQPNSGGAGTSSLYIELDLYTSDANVSPVIYGPPVSVLSHNVVLTENNFNGYYHYLTDVVGTIQPGAIIMQTNAMAETTATVLASNNSMLLVSGLTSSNTSCAPVFSTNSTISVVGNSSVNATIKTIVKFDETSNINAPGSRYISKSTILANNQTAEDIIVYQTSYVPPGTDIYVYAQLKSPIDSESISVKDWSRMTRVTSSAVFSSAADRSDYIDLEYNLPTSNIVFESGASSSGSNSTVLLPPLGGTVADFTPGSFLYFSDVSKKIKEATVGAGGSGYVNGDIVSLANATIAYVNAQFSVTTNSTGGVTTLTVTNSGSYYTNTTINNNTSSNTTGSGTGLTITVSGTTGYSNSNLFNVRQLNYIANNVALQVQTPLSFASGNIAIGKIDGLESRAGAFKYDQNYGIVRYVTNSDNFYDTFQSFAVKYVPVSNVATFVPRVSTMQTLAVQV